MKVILNKNLENLGTVGDMVNVKNGYARNYLIPKAFAVVANESHKKDFEHKKRLFEKKKAIILKDMKVIAKKIEKLSFSIEKQVGENDKIFGSVTTSEIAQLLTKEELQISKRNISFPEDIKKLGKFKVDVKIHPEVIAKLKITITKPAETEEA